MIDTNIVKGMVITLMEQKYNIDTESGGWVRIWDFRMPKPDTVIVNIVYSVKGVNMRGDVIKVDLPNTNFKVFEQDGEIYIREVEDD